MRSGVAVDNHTHFVMFPPQVEGKEYFEKLVFWQSIGLEMLQFFQKAWTGGHKITTQDAITPIEGIRMADNAREKAVDIRWLIGWH